MEAAPLKARLFEWQRRAFERGLMVQAADWLAALAYIEELEARNEVLEASHQRGGQASANAKTAAQHQTWGIEAAKRRWCGRARIETPKLFTT